jgi:single-strand DNA-binding protein
MLNQMVVVGRLVRDPELRETETGKKVTNITLAVPRSYKNTKGEYETDFIDCVLWTGIAESTTEYCKKGDILGIKGRLQTRNIEVGDNKRKYITEVVAEKVTFLSSKNKKEEEE